MDSEALLMTFSFSVVSTLILHCTLIVPNLDCTLQHANLLKICPVKDFKDLNGINPFY